MHTSRQSHARGICAEGITGDGDQSKNFVKALRPFTSVASAVIAENTFVVLIKGGTREGGEETEAEIDE
jgi:hypothetical protein